MACSFNKYLSHGQGKQKPLPWGVYSQVGAGQICQTQCPPPPRGTPGQLRRCVCEVGSWMCCPLMLTSEPCHRIQYPQTTGFKATEQPSGLGQKSSTAGPWWVANTGVHLGHLRAVAARDQAL